MFEKTHKFCINASLSYILFLSIRAGMALRISISYGKSVSRALIRFKNVGGNRVCLLREKSPKRVYKGICR